MQVEGRTRNRISTSWLQFLTILISKAKSYVTEQIFFSGGLYTLFCYRTNLYIHCYATELTFFAGGLYTLLCYRTNLLLWRFIYNAMLQNKPSSLEVYTVPETFYFPIFAFVHRSLTVRLPCVQRALIVRSSFTVLRSPFTVRSRSPFTKRSAFAHRSFTYRSQSVHRSFSVQSSLSFGTLKLKDQYHDLGTKWW